MSKQWLMQTNGDPLGTVQRLIRSVWLHLGLEGVLISAYGSDEATTKPRLIDDPAELSRLNPFKPVMTMNAARLAPELIREKPKARLGVLLRPCELRALVEMAKDSSFKTDNLLTMSIDCLGTFPLEEYQWRIARKESKSGLKAPDGLSRETLQFARQGGIAAYRFRPACQVCESPGAMNADLNLNVFGLPVRQVILVQARDEATAKRLGLQTIDGLRVLRDTRADKALIRQHERTLAKAIERHRSTMERITQGLGEILPQGVDGLIEQLENCGACQACMNVCPICSIHSPRREKDGHYQRESVIRWLVSCAGCGMCEQTCPNHLPLGVIFGYIRNKLDEELDYTPGRSADELLIVPIMRS
jgi:formate dehydrogenase subunit beta